MVCGICIDSAIITDGVIIVKLHFHRFAVDCLRFRFCGSIKRSLLRKERGFLMPYEIAAALDAMPTGRVRKAKVDKYAEIKQLLEQIPEGKVAQVILPQSGYRAFSAGVRAAGVQVGKKATASYRKDSAYVSWEPLTDQNRPKQRGGGRRPQEKEAVAAAPVPAPVQEITPPKRPGRPRRTVVAP